MWLLNKTSGADGCYFQEEVLKDNEPVKKQIQLVMQNDEK